MSENNILELVVSSLKALNSSMEAMNEKIEGIEKRLDSMEKRMDSLERRMDGLEKRLTSLEVIVATIEKDVGELKENVKDLNRRMNAVYDQVAFLTEFRTEMIMFKDETNKRFEKLTKEQEAIKDWAADQEIELRKLKLAQNG
ncbi:hypothetical protein [Caldicellulosiruptor acetigenus]|uniref:Uncharacterized protein n=1 Tax=Caldicellulosiruptor acetigenus 6A TaxID=632516 RepID=G2PYI9_9FIRM|nr:hypothetical protein [Caldicellulosiruptor acetigenus]AEM74039.1 hypothetical protein Calla_1426 [Caldicellulosiruptor acetigenus 6A]